MREDFIDRLKTYEDAALSLEGWQLEYRPEPLEPGPPWDYVDLARGLASRASRVLDLGTGGGEVLTKVLASSRCDAIATEAWHVNAPVAARRLGSRVPVVRTSSLALPFADDSFDAVLSRHEEINPSEVVRVLADDGHCLTQQVIPDIWHELRDVFPDMTRFPNHYVEYQREFIEAGVVLEDAREFRRRVRFRELGHLVYHLAAAPWTIPGFSVQSHREALAELEQRVQLNQGLVLTEGFYLIRVRR